MPDAGEARFASIKKVFQTYDRSGDGFLDISELETVLKTLGTFNNHEIAAVCSALDTSRDGQISYKEFVNWVKNPNGPKEFTKAKAILAPTDDDGLKVVFYNFCGAGHSDMDGKAFMKMCKDCGFLGKGLTETDVDLLFSSNKVKKKGQRTIGFEQFEEALTLLASKKGITPEKVRDVLLESTRPILQGTKAQAVRFHDAPKSNVRDELVQPRSVSKGKAAGARKAVQPVFDLIHRAEEAAQDKAEGYRADNKLLWRTFGIDSTAGRTLKRLYSPPFFPDSPMKGSQRKMRWPPEQDTYVAVNNLHAMTAGLHFRKSKHIQDLCRGPNDYVPWGAAVQGERVDACWLRVGERFLPTEVNGTRLLKRQDGPSRHPASPGGTVIKASSLPALRPATGPAMGARVLVGVPASGPLGGPG